MHNSFGQASFVLHMSGCFRRLLAVFRSDPKVNEAIESIGVFAYAVVGSSVYLDGDECGGDTDVVLLSSSTNETSETALPVLLKALQCTTGLSDINIWFIHAVVCLLKVTVSADCIDILFCGGCSPLPPIDDDQPRTGTNGRK